MARDGDVTGCILLLISAAQGRSQNARSRADFLSWMRAANRISVGQIA
jgi:hypothetical protein